MKGLGSSVTPLEAGVRSDFEALLAKFVEVPSVRFQHFANIFKDMKISLLCRNRSSEGELREFAEKSLRLALSFALPPYSFQARVGGLYLLYGVYFTQVAEHRSKIRVVLDEYHQLLQLIQDLTAQHHYDACFVFHKLAREHAFVFCRFTEEHNPLTYHRIENPYDTDRITEDLKAERAALQDLLDDPLIQQLSTVHDNYYAMKCQLNGVGAVEPAPALGLITENPAEIIQNVMKDCQDRLQRKVLGSRKNPDGKQNRAKQMSRRAQIKAKAYANATSVPEHRRSKATGRQYSSTDEGSSSFNDSLSPGKSPINRNRLSTKPAVTGIAVNGRNGGKSRDRPNRRNVKASTPAASDSNNQMSSPPRPKRATRTKPPDSSPAAGNTGTVLIMPTDGEAVQRKPGNLEQASLLLSSDGMDLESSLVAGSGGSRRSGKRGQRKRTNVSFDDIFNTDETHSPAKSTTNQLDDEVSQIDKQVKSIITKTGRKPSTRVRKQAKNSDRELNPPPVDGAQALVDFQLKTESSKQLAQKSKPGTSIASEKAKQPDDLSKTVPPTLFSEESTDELSNFGSPTLTDNSISPSRPELMSPTRAKRAKINPRSVPSAKPNSSMLQVPSSKLALKSTGACLVKSRSAKSHHKKKKKEPSQDNTTSTPVVNTKSVDGKRKTRSSLLPSEGIVKKESDF